MDNTLLQQALQTLSQARFVRAEFVPLAITHQQWNIAIYESHRATEYLLRSAICYLGHKPPEEHNLNSHVRFLVEHLPGHQYSDIPFTVGAYSGNQSGYGVILVGTTPSRVEVFSLCGNVLTQMGSIKEVNLSDNQHINCRFEIDSPYIRIYLNEICIDAFTDSTATGPFHVIDRSFILDPDVDRIRRLRKLGNWLTQTRAPAFYSEQLYEEEDAISAVAYMNECFEIASTFLYFE